MKEYKVTQEQILKMAEACPTAKDVLMAGFPDAFKETEDNISSEVSIEWRNDSHNGYGPLVLRYKGHIIGHLFGPEEGGKKYRLDMFGGYGVVGYAAEGWFKIVKVNKP
jgi:hypothetical protein